MIELPKGLWDNLRRRIEEILDLPRGSTNPDWKPPSPEQVAKEVVKDVENFLRRVGGVSNV